MINLNFKWNLISGISNGLNNFQCCKIKRLTSILNKNRWIFMLESLFLLSILSIGMCSNFIDTSFRHLSTQTYQRFGIRVPDV